MNRQQDWSGAWAMRIRRSLVNRANPRILDVVRALSLSSSDGNYTLDWRVQQGASE